jgi:Peptidase family S41/N-terminal domain of Peptidase_S41 in eukaryotic IRBP
MEFDLMPLRVLRGLFNSGVVFVFGFGVVLSVGALRDKSVMVSVAGDDAKLDGAERRHVIDGVIKNLKEHYVDREVAQKMADAVLAHEKNGDYRVVTEGGAFADLLTRQMRDVSHDMHLEVVYSRDRLPEHPGAPTAESVANYRRTLERENCTFETVKILPHNIGYLKLNSFPDVSICRSTAAAVMASLNRADAVIFDLRDNRGGSPEMVMLIAAYLFDHPEYMYNPRESPTERTWTRSPVPGNRLADKPVYVLTSGTTWSGADQFSYDLKMLKRATLVGEKTRGGTHAGVFYRIDDHFGMGIPEVKVVNPFSNADWEGVGVEPDVKVKALDALSTAERLAEKKLRGERARGR